MNIGELIWTPERIAELKRLDATGMTNREMANEMGVSRNAVIGKRMRLGMAAHIKPVGAPKQPRPRKGGTPRLHKPAGTDAPTLAIEPMVERIEDQDIPLKQRRTLLQLGNEHCRFPVGHPGTDGFFFCGAEPVKGRPYCRQHYAVAYQGSPPARPFIPMRRERV